MNSNDIKDKSIEELNQCLNEFNTLCQKTESLLKADSQKSEDFIGLTKRLFDLNKRFINENIKRNANEKRFSVKNSLNQLFINGFDGEQVWQQIQLQNQPIIDRLVREVADISVKRHDLSLHLMRPEVIEPKPKLSRKERKKIKKKEKNIIKENENKVKKINDLFSEESDDQSIDQSIDGLGDKKVPKSAKTSESGPKSVVDDMFFKLHELEVFLKREDIKDEQKRSGVQELMSEESDEEDVDYFENSEDSEEAENEDNDNDLEMNGRNAMFDDFFDEPNEGSVEQKPNESDGEESEEMIGEEIDTRDVDTNDLEINDKEVDIDFDDNSSSESEDETFGKSIDKQKDERTDNKSEFERSQESLKEKIAKQERLNLMEKSWQMIGEISAEKRPENSLLEEHLHFDHTSRAAPLITEETTVKVEDIIKQRVKDSAFDDVVRKVKPTEEPFEYRRRITMETEKSKQSLAQIYENEYLKQKQKDKEVVENPEHLEIKKLMRNVFLQLDALSNFNYTPRPPQPEVKIINNLPAVTVEEVTPLAATDVSLLAPQEVFNNRKRELQTNAEKSETDRKRGRRLKKKIQSKKSKFNESKQKVNKTAKELKDKTKNTEKTKHLNSSKKFFNELQEKTKQIVIKSKTQTKKRKIIKQSNDLKL